MNTRLITFLSVLVAIPLFLCALTYGGLYLDTWWHPRSYGVTLGDLDGDGDLDALVANGHTDSAGESPNTVWFNDGRGNFRDSGQRLGDYAEHTWQVLLADLDLDGDLDAVFANNYPATVWLNQGGGQGGAPGVFAHAGKYHLKTKSLNPSFTHSLALGDLDLDGDLDFLAGNCCRNEFWTSTGTDPEDSTFGGYFDSQNVVWFNQGLSRDGRRLDYVASPQVLGNEATGAVALGDLDGDGDLDAYVVNQNASADKSIADPADQIWWNAGGLQGGRAGTFIDSGQRLGQDHGRALALGDLDGDGDLDAFVGNGRGGPPGSDPDRVWLNQGGAQGGAPGHFADSGQVLGHEDTHMVALSDLDGDGDLDGFTDGPRSAQVWVNAGGLQGGAPGSFTPGQRIQHPREWVFNLGDVDGDGDPDLLAAHYERGLQVSLNDGNGNLQVNWLSLNRPPGVLLPALLISVAVVDLVFFRNRLRSASTQASPS